MQVFNTYERRTLGFEINIQGIDFKDLKGSLVFEVENVEYGFPVSILQDHISVSVPPLKDVIVKGLEDKKIINCRLVVHGQGFMLEPWSGEFELSSPVKMEAKMMNIEESNNDKSKKSNKPKITIEGQMKKYSTKKEVHKEQDDISDEEILNLFKKRILKENKTKEKSGSKKPKKSRDQLASDLVSKKINEMNSVVDRVLKGNNFLAEVQESESEPAKKIEQKTKKRNPTNINELFESVGLKNKTIQKKLIERATELSGDDEQSIFSTVEKMLGVKTEGTLFNQYVSKQYEKQH